MAALSPISRADLIKRLKQEWNWTGPFQPLGRKGGKHPYFMLRGTRTLNLPNVHRGQIGVDLLSKVLRQAGISKKEWLGEADDADDDLDSDPKSDDDQPPRVPQE